MPRQFSVEVHGAAFGRGVDLRLSERLSDAAKLAWERAREALFTKRLNLPGGVFIAFLAVCTVALDAIGPYRDKGALCLALPLASVLFFLMWILVGLFQYEPPPPAGRVEVRGDALSCRFADGILTDLPWSQVIAARPGRSDSELLLDHGQHETTLLWGTSAELRALRADIQSALDDYLPVEVANRLLRNDGKPIRDWLASVRSRFAPGAYRAGPPPLTRDQLVHLVLSPRVDAEVRVAAAAALSVMDGERTAMSRVRIVTRQVESPALRIAAERALEDALDEAALAEATAEAPGARMNQG